MHGEARSQVRHRSGGGIHDPNDRVRVAQGKHFNLPLFSVHRNFV